MPWESNGSEKALEEGKDHVTTASQPTHPNIVPTRNKAFLRAYEPLVILRVLELNVLNSW